MMNFNLFNSAWINKQRIRKAARNLERENDARRNITRYRPSDIEGFIEKRPQVGSYVISGGNSQNRSRTVAAVVMCALTQSIPVIVLHRGDLSLQFTIESAMQIYKLFMPRKKDVDFQMFLSQLAYQDKDVFLSSRTDTSVSIRTAVEQNGLIMIDVGANSSESILDLLVSEINEEIETAKKIMLVIDDINMDTDTKLSKLIKDLPERCLTTMVSGDVYSMLARNESLFQSFVENADQCIVFSHSAGDSCSKWSGLIGYHDGELRVEPKDIRKMTSNEVYILEQDTGELACTQLR